MNSITYMLRDGRFRVNDEIINVNGSSLRGLSMEQVFININSNIIEIIAITIIIIIHDTTGEKCFEEHLPKCGHHHCKKSRRFVNSVNIVELV